MITFIANWFSALHKDKNVSIKNGEILFKVKPVYIPAVIAMLKKFNARQEKNKEDKAYDIKITLEPYYKKRTLDQNALRWALLKIQANEMNGGRTGADMITPEKLHKDELYQYGRRAMVIMNEGEEEWLKSEYHVVATHPGPFPGKISVEIIIGTRHLNTVEMAEWIERKFDEISEYGVNSSKDILLYWNEWRGYLNQEKIVLNDNLMSVDAYKEKVNICEACGQHLLGEEKVVCHIKARGMGGKHEAEKDYGSNLLCMHNKCHIQDQHEKGWDSFLNKYPHLRHKVETALKREIETVKTEPEFDYTDIY